MITAALRPDSKACWVAAVSSAPRAPPMLRAFSKAMAGASLAPLATLGDSPATWSLMRPR